jgi:transposase InsO family protein
MVTPRKRQLSFQLRKDAIEIILTFGIACIAKAIRHCQCCERTVFYYWSQYNNGGQNLDAVKPKQRTNHNPNTHTEEEHNLIVSTLADYPNASYTRIYTLLVSQGYTRSYKGMWGYVDKHKLRGDKYTKYAHHVPKPYYTPLMLGFKWQMDVKYLPRQCIDGKHYQFTMTDESNRTTFEYAYNEKSTYSTKDFIIRAIRHFGYMPVQIQTDNGTEFTNKLIAGEEHKVNLVDAYLDKVKIDHKLIRPATPRHNGKVERRHREDHRNYLQHHFDNLPALNKYLRDWCEEKDNTFTFALCPKCQKSPRMKRQEQLQELKRFAKSLNLNRRTTLQEMIYAYCEWERIKQERLDEPPKHILHLPTGITLAEDIQNAIKQI